MNDLVQKLLDGYNEQVRARRALPFTKCRACGRFMRKLSDQLWTCVVCELEVIRK